jgi:hypothetical protein
MEDRHTGGEFDAHGLMQLHQQLQPKPAPPLSKGFLLAIWANVAMPFTPFLLSAVGLGGIAPPPLWLVLLEASAPWIAVAAVLRFPERLVVFFGGRRVPLFGVWTFAALAPMGVNAYRPLVRTLPAVELGLLAGAVLFAAAAVSLPQPKAIPLLILPILPLSLLYGFTNVVQVNWMLDRSPATMFTTAVTHKSPAGRSELSLNLQAWGANPEQKSLSARDRVSVTRETFDAVRVGGPVCVMQREGALGIAWYTAQACP